MINDWERTRLQTFILFNSNRTRKSFIAWPKFRKDVFPLDSDSDYSSNEVTEEQIAATWKPEDWKRFFNKGKESPNGNQDK
jgi:hypothetical protein